MPRDLHELWTQATEQTLEDMPSLSEQPSDHQSGGEARASAMDIEPDWEPLEEQGPVGVKVYPKALTLSDVDACVILEDAAFPPEQRCSREKFIYRLTVSPELCHGLFTTSSPDYDPHHLTDAPTAAAAKVVETSSARKQILIAHAIGTLSTNETILDDDMALPPAWTDGAKDDDGAEGKKLGHKKEGRVACLHSLAVLPGYQGKRVGTTMLKGYIDLLRASGNYDRLVLLADKSHVDYYEARGFENLGKSKASFGGVEWFDMAMDFDPNDDDDYD